MNLLDLLLVALIGLAAFSGFRRGALLQLITYAGLLLGLFVGALVAPAFGGLTDDPFLQSAVTLGAFLALAGIGDAVGWFVGAKAWAATRGSRFQPVDAAGGSLVAVVALLLAAWFIALNLVHGPFPTLAREAGGSAIIRGLDEVLPEPPSLLNGVRRLLDRFGFPEVFAGLPEQPAAPVTPPTERQAARAFAAADDSTVRIVGQACDRIQEGSGFYVASSYVVTNAHVVAGMQSPQVQDKDNNTLEAQTVLFDPDTDIAVLSVPGASGPVLQLAPEEQERGARGAVLGYPQGGGLDGSAAAVRRTLEALGRDIYGRDTVVRDVYELQSVIRPGNSGGPFVLVNGEVAGVVFAASNADPNVGYALTSGQVAPIVNAAVGLSAAVSTGPCID